MPAEPSCSRGMQQIHFTACHFPAARVERCGWAQQLLLAQGAEQSQATGISKPSVAGRGSEQKAGLEVCEENSKRLAEGKPLMCRGRGACVHCPVALTSLSLSRRRTDRRQHPTPHDSAHRGTARRTCQHHQLGLRTPSAPA